MLIQGGRVERERYFWLAERLGDEGFAVVVPQYAADLAITGGERTHRSLEEARDLGLVGEGPAIVMGHSLGGVVAASQWVEYPKDYAELVLLASWPASNLEVESRDERVLELVGSEDGEPLSAFVEGTARFTDLECHVIEGMTHYDWTDDATDREIEKQGTVATRPIEETRAEAVSLLLDFLDRR